MTKSTLLIAFAVVLAATGAFAAQAATFRIHAADVDPTVSSQVHADLVWSEQRIRSVLGEFPDTVSVRIHASRERFSRALREAWGVPETSCWMVGAADDHTLHVLSPASWSEEACEHDPDDTGHVRRLLAHEALHVYHGQSNPAGDVGLLEDLGWFSEGLATYLSGQLEAEHASDAVQAIRSGAAPDRLTHAWSGRYRYGVAGSMAAFIDQAWGREKLRDLLTVTSNDELLCLLGLAEDEFLDRWQAWVTA